MKKTKLLFIPGYFGSTLVDRTTGESRWVRVSDFFSNKYDLCMTESYTDLSPRNNVTNGDVMMTVKILPKILEIESYQKTLKHLGKFCEENYRELYTVSYDWRDDFHASIKKISEKINELTSDGSKIEVVAHSNGGVLISYYLRYGDSDFFDAKEDWSGLKKISKVSIVASPLRGALSLFKHMKDGTAVLKNKKLMGSLDYTSFKSSYFFLPDAKLHLGYENKKGESFRAIDLFDINVWIKNKWGPYIDRHNQELPVNNEKFDLLLMRAKKFQELMMADTLNPPSEKIKIQVIKAIGRPTYFFPTFPSIDNQNNYHYPKLDREDGDGVVAHMSSDPLLWFNNFDLDFKTFRAEHLKVMSEFKYQKYVHKFLL